MPKTSRVMPNKLVKEETNIITSDSNGWDELGLDDNMRIAVYGRTATGKTTFASTAPGPILWLIASGGKKPGELRSINTPEMRKKVTPKVIRHTDEIMEQIQLAEDKYRTVVVDHITGVQTLIIMEVKNLKTAPIGFAQSNAQAAKGLTLITEQEWGFIGTKGIDILRELLSIDCNSIIIAQQRESKPKKKDNQADFEGEDILLPFVGCQVTPMIATWLNPAVDFILQTFIRPKVEKYMDDRMKGQPPVEAERRIPGKYEYCIRTGEHDLFTTKFRMPRGLRNNMPEAIANPTFDKILALSKGEMVSDD